jgi:hypothetical protein
LTGFGDGVADIDIVETGLIKRYAAGDDAGNDLSLCSSWCA